MMSLPIILKRLENLILDKMKEVVSLKEWLDNHNITYSLRKDVVVIPGFGRCLIQDDYDHIFKQTKEGNVVFNSIENYSYLIADEIYYIVFPFGCRWFYIDVRKDPSEVQFKILRYVGNTPTFQHECEFYPLGIHSGYELLNGSGLLKDWCTKTKFLGYKGLAVSDRNTMAASLDLQQSATDAGLKYCFGYSLTVRTGKDKVGVKLYSATQQGFKNMLRIQKAIAVDNYETKEIDLITLLNLAEGNTLVFDKWSGHWLTENKNALQDFVEAFDGWVFFQVDTSEYRADRIDSALLQSQKAYFDNFYQGNLEYSMNIRPVLIQDVYYLDKEDWRTKVILNKVDTGAAHEQSYKQYLKTIDEIYDEFRALFSDRYDDDVFYDMCEATADIIENASAAYDLSDNYAPKYDMTPQEREKYGDTLTMFRSLIEEGFKKLVPEGEEEEYRKRVEYEKYVIESTDNVDYFLIQRDELNWAQENGILTGIGRGSAGGCLLLYLMGITFIDPLKYDLIFERFLLPERAGLEPDKVTVMADDIESSDYFELALDDDKILLLDKDAELVVIRNGEQLTVYADELQEGDDIQFDNCDILHTLPKKFLHENSGNNSQN